MDKNNIKPILQFSAILTIGAIVVLVTTVIANQIREPSVLEKPVEKLVPIKAPDCALSFDDFKSLSAKGQNIQLARNVKTYASGGRFVNDIEITVNRSGSGEIACGYLYARARVDGRELDPRYESIYVNPQGLGGHILRTKSIDIDSEIQNSTEVLFPLNTVSYLPNLPYNPQAQNFQLADWVKLLNVSNQTEFKIALSVQNLEGVIDEVQIAYKCWNPQTGQETNDCQLSIIAP